MIDILVGNLVNVIKNLLMKPERLLSIINVGAYMKNE